MNIYKVNFHKAPLHLIVYQGQRWLMAGELQHVFGLRPSTDIRTDLLPDAWFRSLNHGPDYEVWGPPQVQALAVQLGVPSWFANGRVTVIKERSLPELHSALCEEVDYKLAFKFVSWVREVLSVAPAETAPPPPVS